MSLITITGPTGAGKTTLARELEKLGIKELVSTTTRDPRPGEVDGDHYFFMTPWQFEQTLLVESIKYGENFYGLSEEQVLQAKTADRVVVLEPHGLEQVTAYCLKHMIPLFSVYITAPVSLLVKRLIARGGDPTETLMRISKAIEEDCEWGMLKYDDQYLNIGESDLKWICGKTLDILEALK